MGSPDFGDVVPYFLVDLNGFLGGLRVGATGEPGPTAEIQTDSRRGIENVCSQHCICDVVGEPVVGEANAMDGRSPADIETEGVTRCVVAALKRLEVAASEGIHHAAVVIGEAVEKLRSRREFVIQAACQFSLVKRSIVARFDTVERGVENPRGVTILLEIFAG